MRRWMSVLLAMCCLMGSGGTLAEEALIRVMEQRHDGWCVQMPAVVGLSDPTLQASINQTIVAETGLDQALMQLGQLRATNAVRDEYTTGIDAFCTWQETEDAWTLSMTLRGKLPAGREGEANYGFTYDRQGKRLALSDLFSHVDDAMEGMTAIALADQAEYGNAYAEQNQIEPMPRDMFGFENGQLIIYYPDTQLSCFSGRAGAYAFYAYELAPWLKEESSMRSLLVPESAQKAIAAGRLPGVAWAIGSQLSAAFAACGQREESNFTDANSVFLLEAPTMRGISLLSDMDAEEKDGAVVRGIRSNRMNLDGLTTGSATVSQCEAVWGVPIQVENVDAQAAYDQLLPEGETRWYAAQGYLLGLHFVEGVLHTVWLTTP